MIEVSTDRWARFRDTCPKCGDEKSKTAELCQKCRQAQTDANRKHPKRERNRQSEYDQCPTCDDRKYKKADQCQTCSVERPLKACTQPGCQGRIHRTPPPEWLEEAAEMARANIPCLQIAQHFHTHANEVRRWLPHAGVLPHKCLEDGCDTEVGPGSPYCRKHVARHREAPGPRVERPENLAELAPPASNFDSREAYIDGVCEALKIKDWRLSEWMGLDMTTLWRLKRDPGIIPSEKTTQASRDHLRAPMEELVRLGLALEEGQKNPRLIAAGHASIEAYRAKYGDEALKERGRRGMAAFRASQTPEQLKEYERMAHEAAREKLTGKRHPDKLVTKMKQKRWDKKGWLRRKKRKEHGDNIRLRCVNMGERAKQGWKSEVRRARHLLWVHGRRKHLEPEHRELLKRLYLETCTPEGCNIADLMRQLQDQGVGAGRDLVMRELLEMAEYGEIPQPAFAVPKWYMTRADVEQAQRIVDDADRVAQEAQEQARKNVQEAGQKSQAATAKERYLTTVRDLNRRGRNTTDTAIRKRSKELFGQELGRTTIIDLKRIHPPEDVT